MYDGRIDLAGAITGKLFADYFVVYRHLQLLLKLRLPSKLQRVTSESAVVHLFCIPERVQEGVEFPLNILLLGSCPAELAAQPIHLPLPRL